MTELKIRTLTNELENQAKTEVNEQTERLNSNVQALKLWIKQQPHLKARTDDQLLVSFLRGCKFSLEKTKNKIDRFYALRSKLPEYFNFKPSDLNDLIEIIKMG